MPSSLRVIVVLVTAILLQGCIVKVNADTYGRDIDRVFGSIDIDDGQQVGNVDSVNGSIRLGDESVAEDVETVNGSIRAGRRVRVDSLETVNGSIRAGRGLQATGSLETVNGRIELREDSTVERDVSTVNGSIELEGTTVGGSIETVNGNVLLESSTVEGDIVFEDNNGGGWGWFRNKDEPRLTIDDRSEVQGTIILYRPVELRIDEGATIGDIERRYDAR